MGSTNNHTYDEGPILLHIRSRRIRHGQDMDIACRAFVHRWHTAPAMYVVNELMSNDTLHTIFCGDLTAP